MHLNINSLFRKSLTSPRGGTSNEPGGSRAQWIQRLMKLEIDTSRVSYRMYRKRIDKKMPIGRTIQRPKKSKSTPEYCNTHAFRDTVLQM